MRFLILSLALSLAPAVAFADSGSDVLAGQRQQYRAAKSALQRGDPQPFLRARSLLADYPLYPYLEFAELRRRLPALPQAEVERFLERHGNGLPAARLRVIAGAGHTVHLEQPEVFREAVLAFLE